MKPSFKLIWFLIGLGLCSSVPLCKLGPSFIVWPSFSELSGGVLLIIATLCCKRKKQPIKTIVPVKQIALLLTVTLVYIYAVTIVFTVLQDFEVKYPLWSLLRFTQWAIIFFYILFVCERRYIKLLACGIAVGGIINASVSILQNFQLLRPSIFCAHLNDMTAGPWMKAAKDAFTNRISIGVFSYSRTSTGYFLTLSFLICILYFKKDVTKFIITILFVLGVAFTGSRLGFLCIVFVLAMLLLYKSLRPVIFGSIFVILFLSIVYLQEIADSPVLGRLFGFNETYIQGIEGRVARQSRVFQLSMEYFVFGCGIGNLGNALKISGYNLCRAHGVYFTYLAEIGIVGCILFLVVLYKSSNKLCILSSYFGLIALCLLLISGLTSDFMIPSASAHHIPIIGMITLRFAVTETSVRIKFLSHVAFGK